MKGELQNQERQLHHAQEQQDLVQEQLQRAQEQLHHAREQLQPNQHQQHYAAQEQLQHDQDQLRHAQEQVTLCSQPQYFRFVLPLTQIWFHSIMVSTSLCQAMVLFITDIYTFIAFNYLTLRHLSYIPVLLSCC